MIIFIPLILIIARSHLFISTTPSTATVAALDSLTFRILTTANINNNTLAVSLSTDFTLSPPCQINSVTAPCTITATTNAVTALFSSSFASNTYYNLILNVTNPIYAANFQVSATVSGTPFSNTGLVTINPSTISCSMTSSSSYVGDIGVGYFSVGNSAIPANSIVTISSAIQTNFSNLFTANPTCMSASNSSLPCTVSTNFGQQYLTVSNVPQSPGLSITVSFINNAPYNGSLYSILLQIQNANGYYMQTCSFKQPAATILRNSTGLLMNGWNSQVGATSNVTFTLSTYFTPIANNINWVYDQALSIAPLYPASFVVTNYTSSLYSNYISGATAIGQSLSFSASITNPPSTQPLSSSLYVIYSNTLFIEQYSFQSMVLTQLDISLTNTVNDLRTSTLSSYNSSVTIPYSVPGAVITLTLNYNNFACTNISLTTNAGLQLGSCSSNSLILFTNSTLAQGLLWIAYNVTNYFSLKAGNTISFAITGPAPNYYSIGKGNTSISLIVNNQSFSIVNMNSTYASATSIAVLQNAANINSSISRRFVLQLPIDIILSANTSVLTTAASSIITSFSINVAACQITINIAGVLAVQINNLKNPIKFNGSLLWTITSFDLVNNPSSISTASQLPSYTPATVFFNYSLSSTIIQSAANLNLTIIPTLQYYTPPTITISLSNSLITTLCSSCISLSSTSVTLPYSSAIMQVILGISNSELINNNSITITIGSNLIVYESATLSYSLRPTAFGYIVTQSGLYGTIGNINITIVSSPSKPVILTYSDVSPILQNPTCISCSNTQLLISGIVQYFQTFTVTITGTYGGQVYASSIVTINYVCQSILGCRMCSNQTVNGKTSLICQSCFDSSKTSLNLLYSNQCLQSCPISTYSNTVSCVDCPNLCYICSMTSCSQCIPSYYLFNNSCIQTCPIGYIANATHCIPYPIICPSNCIDCPADNKCLACSSAYLLYNNTCYSSCPSGYVSSGVTCILFIPPEQAKYFPFVFVISSVLFFFILTVIKCFQKRSLVMGNLIAFISIAQTGSMIMTLVYTLMNSSDLLTQALCFVLLLSKILLNIIFLIYFLKAVAKQEHFIEWREEIEANEQLFRTLTALGAIFSFQLMRVIYSRLLGLRLFFGRFNTAIIFRPLNFLTLGYFLTCSLALGFLCVRNIINQKGYHTSTYYTSIQSIILELLLALSCLVDWRKGYDNEFFEYQIYKVDNDYESHIQPIVVEGQAENAGSMHEMLNAVASDNEKHRSHLGQIVKNSPLWVARLPKEVNFTDKQVQSQMHGVQCEQQTQEQLLQSIKQEVKQEGSGMVENRSFFRKKIIEDWRRIQKSLPNKFNESRMAQIKKKRSKKSHSPDDNDRRKKRAQKDMKRVSSVQKIEIKLPECSDPLPTRIKNYFYNISPISKNEKFNIASKLENPFDNTLEVEKNLSEDAKHSEANEALLKNSQQLEAGQDKSNEVEMEKQESDFEGQAQNYIDEETEENQEGNQADQELIGHTAQRLLNRQANRYADSTGNLEQPRQMDSFAEGDIKLYSNGLDELDYKKYRSKKRKVNRQTEQVYLQRLVGTSQKKNRVRPRKLEF